MFGKKKAADARIPEDVVTLKPLFGLRPGVYLAVLYGAALLIAAFFALVFPGLHRPGSVMVLSSEPWGAAVRVDDVYVGTTPCEVFVAAGPRRFTAVLPGFKEVSLDYTVGKRIFASVLFPRQEELSFTPERESPAAPLLAGAASYARWSFAGEGSAVYQIPLDLSEGAYRAAIGEPTEDQEDLLRASARFAASGTALRDLLRARFLLDASGAVPSPASALRSVGTILSYLHAAEGSPAWLATVLPADAVSTLAESSWYLKAMDSAVLTASSPAPELSAGGTITVAGVSFRELPGAEVVLKGSYPRRERIGAFYIADRELAEDAFALFIAENPEWAAAAREELVRKGLAGNAYLETPDFPSHPRGARSGVSWFAAQAYCEWLTRKLPSSLSGYVVRLPTEAEWEYAATAAAAYDLSGMAGALWEWCADPFVPLDFLPPSLNGMEERLSPERSVRGGSWVNASSAQGPSIRGSLPPSSSSPFVGFRPVLSPKEQPR